ncbi:M3 family oligoendopeptidase [Balneolaceae bacterium ANBcel3]|nr:M3 family oligoendopeptidase [Balneolaceae bacterium ANBcel3]
MSKEKKTGAENVYWNISDLYDGLESTAFKNDTSRVKKLAADFSGSYRGKVHSLTENEFADALKAYAELVEIISKMGSYVYLKWTTNTEDPALGKALQQSNELSSEISRETMFFHLEWLDLDDEQADRWLQSKALESYRHYLKTSRMGKPYKLDEKEEKILSAKSVTGKSAWVRFFDETLGAARFHMDGEELTESEILSKSYHSDRAIRQKASEVFTEGLKKLNRPLTYAFNTLLADKYTNDTLRGYPHWLKPRNIANEISDESVQSLIDAVTSSYSVVQRYYELKRKLLGLDILHEYDRYAPIAKSNKTVAWKEAKTWVLDAYHDFHPEMGATAELFFEHEWIDAAIRPGKRGGAYSASTVPSVHPYVFMNYDGQLRDVQTLAHELGHGVHQYLSQKQGILQCGTPLTTAETASVFGEMLVFKKMLSSLQKPEDRLALLIGKIDDSIATIFRQVSMNQFEDRIHQTRRKEGELAPDQFSELWMETQVPLYGSSVTLTDNYRWWWSYIPHFIHTPGYVYAYAFGELLVMALFEKYEQSGDGFAAKYIQMLEKGGSDSPESLMNALGVDLKDPDFWFIGLRAVEHLVHEAEALYADMYDSGIMKER